MVVDSSALAAVLFQEDDGNAYLSAMLADPDPVLSAATLVEISVVVTRRLGPDAIPILEQILDRAGLTITPFTAQQSLVAQQAYIEYGRGRHPAALNFGDCFSYALAKTEGMALVFKGRDFSLTDINAARV